MTDGQKAIPSKVEITDKLALTDAVDKLCLEILEGKMLTTIALEWGVTQSSLMYWLSADSTRSARVRESRRVLSDPKEPPPRGFFIAGAWAGFGQVAYRLPTSPE